MVDRARRDLVGIERRRVLGLVPVALAPWALQGVLAPLAVGVTAAAASGCATIIGEEDVDAYFLLKPDAEGNFYGWSEITISGADPEEDDAQILQALLEAIDGATDLTFIDSIVAEAVTPETRAPLAEGSGFPSGESIVPLDVVHDGGIAQFFTPAGDGDSKIRIEWTGKARTDVVYPEEGFRVNVRIKVEVL